MTTPLLYLVVAVMHDGVVYAPQLTIDERVVSWHYGDLKSIKPEERLGRWHVRYRLTYHGSSPIEIGGSDISVEYDGLISNSAAKPHTIPRRSQVAFSLNETNTLHATIIANANDRHRCREKISIAFSSNASPETDPFKGRLYFIPLRLTPNSSFWCYLRLEHEHFLYGMYDPLLGSRQLTITLGRMKITDELPLNDVGGTARPPITLSVIPENRRDERQFRSAPDSLLIAADIPGCQYFRFDDIPVRYGTNFKLSFWYLAAIGTEGSCHARVMEYQDTPNAWYRLDGGFDEQLVVCGRWRKFEKIFQIRDETTTLAIDFRNIGANVGEMWLDDIELIPLDYPLDNDFAER